jgi:hypothetical protein
MIVRTFSGKSSSCAKLAAYIMESSILDVRIAADQKAVTPIALHRREVKGTQDRHHAVWRHIPLPQINRTLDIPPLAGPLLRYDRRGLPFGLVLV